MNVALTSRVGSALLERDEALAALHDALTDARTRRGSVVFVAGEAGVGKTALVQRFLEEGADEMRVLVGACDPLFTPRPLGPFVDVAHATGGQLHELVVTGAIPYRIAEVLMEELKQSPPTVVVLEDLHWADEATLDVLRLLARRVEESGALVIATYRDDELDARHPLRIVLGSLSSVSAARRLRVLPLSRAAVAQLAEPQEADAEELYRLTSGNPFYVTEVLAGNVRSIPETVRDAILARAATLSSRALEVLEAVSTTPEGAEPWLLAGLAHQTDQELAECLSSGMLTEAGSVVVFRHELARLAIEGSVTPERRVLLHQRALATLRARSSRTADAARLAHHADGAGDAEAVLRFAPAAAARASSLAAHREAAAQYRRALRYADGLPLGDRAELLERYSSECYLTDETDEAMEALRSAADVYQELGDRLKEGATLGKLATILWCPGRGKEGRRVGLDSVTLLEGLGPTPELAYAYDRMAFLARMNADLEAAAVWSSKATSMAETVGDRRAIVWTSGGQEILEITSGSSAAIPRYQGRADRARRKGRTRQLVDILDALVLALLPHHGYTLSREYVEEGVALSRECGHDLSHLYFLAHRARIELDRGGWGEAAEVAELVLGERFVSTYPRTVAMVALALVRARRGDPDVWGLLDGARDLSEPTGELPRIAPVAVARAEAAWLTGRSDAVAAETDTAFRLALPGAAPWTLGELAVIRWRAGIEDDLPEQLPEPHSTQIAGRWREAASIWVELGCRYEAALALADGDTDAQRRALDALHELGAAPAAAIVARRLRARGVRGVPRGPRPSTRKSPAGLTARESEVLALLAEGRQNAEIADRLVLSRRTVDHHVSAILRKLGAHTRGEAVANAAQLALLQDR
jgi:DNA-binding CsgD family transcriptional regulator/tetratricopeptide (TPR) repeat protein